MVEVTNISPHGIWVFIGGKEYLLPFETFPWFKKATIEQIQKVESPYPGQLNWSDLVTICLGFIDPGFLAKLHLGHAGRG